MSSAMPPKARIPAMTVTSIERNSSTKAKGKSRSKERRNIAGTIHEPVRPFGADPILEHKVHGLSLANQRDGAQAMQAYDAIGSGLRPKGGKGLGQRASQTQLQIPSQRPIFRLLQSFKLQQYSKHFVDMGFGEDVYKLTMITQRKKQEIIDSIDMLPGHRQRLLELFRRIDHMYPRQNVTRMLESATRQSSRQSQSRLSSNLGGQTADQSLNISTTAESRGLQVSRDALNTAGHGQSTGLSAATPMSLLQTQPVSVAKQDETSAERPPSGIPLPTQFPPRSRHGTISTSNGKSPTPHQKQRKGNQAGSLVRKFNALESGARTAINDSFLQNIRSGKQQATTVSDALREFYGKDMQVKQKVISKIFANSAARSNSNGGVKTHHSLAQANGLDGSSGQVTAQPQGGFGLQKFVKVQKACNVIDQYRSQVSSQGGASQANKTVKKQASRTDIQPFRKLDKRAKNSNSSTDSKPPAVTILRKGSHPAQNRKKNTSTSSERREAIGQPYFKGQKGQNSQVQARNRVTSHSRVQLAQSGNFMIGNPASRGNQNNGPGKTRLHRVRSATGYKDVGSAEKQQTQATHDYSSGSGDKGPKPRANLTAGQQAAIKRVQLHRQRSAQKQISMTHNHSISVQEDNSARSAAKPPVAAPSQGIPHFFQNPSANQQKHQAQKAQGKGNARRQISRDRGPLDFNQVPGGQPSQSEANTFCNNSSFLAGEMRVADVSTTSASKTDQTQDFSSRLQLLKRSSSQGQSRRDVQCAVAQSRRSRDSRNNTAKESFCRSGDGQVNQSVGEAVSQSAAFTEFKIIRSPDQLEEHQAATVLPQIRPQSSSIQKSNPKGEEYENCSVKSTNAMHPANASKPPMSTSKRSAYSSKAAESIKSAQQMLINSPEKSLGALRLQGASPRRPLVLEPIQNPPTVEAKLASNTDSKTNLIQAEEEPVPPTEPTPVSPEPIKREHIKETWTPLIDKKEKAEAREFGHSFGSKKVAMGPGFVNLRFICHCLARAIKRHLEFSKGDQWFLQDLQKEQDDIDLEFSYQLPPDLKLTLNPKGVRIQEEDDDVNPFQREGEHSPLRDIETMDIEVDAFQKLTGASDSHINASGNSKGRPSLTTGLGEPEPEIIKSSESEDNSARISKFKNISQKEETAGSAIAEDIEEEVDDEVDNYSNGFDEEDPEDQSIKEMRRDQVRKSVFEKDQERLNSYLNQRKVNELESKLKNKDRQIAQLTRIVQKGGVNAEVMAISAEPDTQSPDDQEGWFDRGGVKMDRAEWLMAQVDLDPIESHGSMEMSTTKFKTLHGKRFVNSEGGNGAMEDSRTSQSTRPPFPGTDKKQGKKSQRSYESAFIDVSEDKMREFVMGQLRFFDMRMEYDEMVFNEDQFVPMPSEKYIADYCKYVTIACKMENEIPIVCLVYLEKLLLRTGILLNKWNWRRLVLVCLCLASKIWDDDSLENVHFPKVMSDVTNLEINKLEQLFLEFIDYKLVIKGGEYAKYYFILRSMAEDINKERANTQGTGSGQVPALSPFENTRRNKANKEEWAEFPLRAPISAGKMLELQRSEVKAEVFLKERHEREFLNAFICNTAGSRKDQTRHPSLLLDRTM